MSALVIALPPAPPRVVSRFETLTLAAAVAGWISDVADRDPPRRDAILRTVLADVAAQIGVCVIIEPEPPA